MSARTEPAIVVVSAAAPAVAADARERFGSDTDGTRERAARELFGL